MCWLCLDLKDDAADAYSTIKVSCTAIKTSDGLLSIPDTDPRVFRIGVALRKPGDDGVFSSRIPGLVTTNSGTLIAMYDAFTREPVRENSERIYVIARECGKKD